MTTGGDRTSRQPVAERIRHNVHRIVGRRVPEATLDRDLRALNAGWDFSSYVVPPARGAPRRVVGLVRQLLLRLMYPLLQHESAWAGANTRIVWTNRVERLSAVQEELARIHSSDTVRGASVNTLGDSIAIDMFALEGAFRGQEEEIRRRQRRYVELFRGRTAVLDVGCGRGEFLGLLLEHGIEASGVDPDSRMVEHCRAKGLDVTFDDAIHHLEQADDASLGGIFAAQLIEHLSPQALLALVSLSARKLRTGGALLSRARIRRPCPRCRPSISISPMSGRIIPRPSNGSCSRPGSSRSASRNRYPWWKCSTTWCCLRQ